MRDGERFWWAQLLVGLVFCLTGVVGSYVILLISVPWGDPFMTPADYAQILGIIALLAVVCLGAGLWFALSSVPLRRRHQARIAVLAGDEAAMPLASIRPDPALAPDVEAQPLELLWRAGASAQFVQGPLAIVQLLAGLFEIGLTVLGLSRPSSCRHNNCQMSHTVCRRSR